MRNSLMPILAALLIPALSAADTLGVRVGANYWHYDIGGTARYKTSDSDNDVDVNKDLGYGNGNLGYYYVRFEQPIPLLPNVKISKTDINKNADGRLTNTVVYGDITYQANEQVSSKVELDQTDITLYYSLLDNVIDVDLGLNAKHFDSKARITGASSGTQTADVSGWVPMAYAGIGANLPLTGLSISADGAYVRYKSSSFYDFTVRATYTSPWFVGADVGYRRIKLNLDDFDDSFAEVEFDGPYAGLYLNF